MPAPWWERFPGRLESELADLDALGAPHQLNEELRDRDGVIQLTVQRTVGDRTYEPVATYPDNYPYFQVVVQAPADDNLDRHRSPDHGSLCLVGRRTERWDTNMSLAWLLEHKFPRLLEAVDAQGTERAADLEERQGEPYSDYYSYAKPAHILVDSSWSLPPDGGEVVIGYTAPLQVYPRELVPVFTGAVLEVRGRGGEVVARAPDEWADRFTDRIVMPWVRLDEPLQEFDANRFAAALIDRDQRLANTRFKEPAVVKEGRHGLKFVRLIGVVFPEELRWQEYGDGWVFVLQASKSANPHPGSVRSAFVQAFRYGQADLYARVPELWPLRTKTVLVVGNGGIGAPLVLELARAGVGEIRLLDHDHADPSASVRWPFGLTTAGAPKVGALAGFVQSNYPYVKVVPYEGQIGRTRLNQGEPSELEDLDRVMDGIDLVIDATAEFGVHHLLSDLAAERNIPYLYLFARRGGWGGLVARIRAGQTGCWVCLQHHIADGTVQLPPEDPHGELQPRGCADPTFTASGFDLATVSLPAVRLAVAELCNGAEGTYPEAPWDGETITLRTEDGTLTHQVSGFTIPKHPKCCA